MDPALQKLVWQRAGDRCEYCRVHQSDDAFYRFHIEHIVARKHGGPTEPGNLALSCQHCNLHKGTDLTGIDPATGSLEPLFHPRTQKWSDHFSLSGPLIVGLTATGRATIRVLKLNAPPRVRLRAAAQYPAV